jgi:hypothetical protein
MKNRPPIQLFREAIDAYAAATGDRVNVIIRPQRGVVDRARHDIEVNSPEMIKLGFGVGQKAGGA